jgi:hypothetical protein
LYDNIVCVRFTFIQLRAFIDDARRARLADDDLRAIENEIMRRPLAWPLMAGTGGLRKMRYAPQASGHGKSGGARVCFFLADDAGRVYLIQVFSKHEKENLNAAERGTIKRMISLIRANLKTEP